MNGKIDKTEVSYTVEDLEKCIGILEQLVATGRTSHRFLQSSGSLC